MGGKRPGVMFYFDLRPARKRLSIEDKGRLFESILDYAEIGLVPDLDGLVAVAWDFIQPRIDKDGERYDEISRKRKEAVSVRWEREKTKQMNTSDTNVLPSIQTIPTTTPTTTTYSTATADGGCGGKSEDVFWFIEQERTFEAETGVEKMSPADFDRKRIAQIEKLRRWTG